MDKIDVTAVVGLLSALSGLILGWTGRSKQAKQQAKDEATVDAVIRTDIGYIKHSVDDVRMMQGQQGQKFDVLTEKVIRAEESAKQAHKRIDRLEGSEGRG